MTDCKREKYHKKMADLVRAANRANDICPHCLALLFVDLGARLMSAEIAVEAACEEELDDAFAGLVSVALGGFREGTKKAEEEIRRRSCH